MCSPPKPSAIRALPQATGANSAAPPSVMKQSPMTGTIGTEYRLTERGRRALEQYLDHMEALIQAVRER